MNQRLHVIVPAADRDAANDYLDDRGMGPNSFSVPIWDDSVADGDQSVTFDERGEISECNATHWGGSGVFDDGQLAKLGDLVSAIRSVAYHDDSRDFESWVTARKLSARPPSLRG